MISIHIDRCYHGTATVLMCVVRYGNVDGGTDAAIEYGAYRVGHTMLDNSTRRIKYVDV